MESRDFIREQFVALRQEILARQARLFWTVVIGLLGVPTITYWAADAAATFWLVVPFFVLVVIVKFLAEQNGMMRAGRFIREQIETRMEGTPGWEAWLENRAGMRVVEKHFFGCFVIIFFLYYFLSIAMAVQKLWVEAADDPAGQSYGRLYGAIVVYVIGTIWAINTLTQHWKSSVSTTAEPKIDLTDR